MSPLESATTDELLHELRRRHPELVFAGRGIGSDATADNLKIAMTGSPIVRQGLIALLAQMTSMSMCEFIASQRPQE